MLCPERLLRQDFTVYVLFLYVSLFVYYLCFLLFSAFCARMSIHSRTTALPTDDSSRKRTSAA